MAKLLTTHSRPVKECGGRILYGIKLIYKDKVQMKHKEARKNYELKKLEGIKFVHGCGKRKLLYKKSAEKLEEYL